MLLAQGAYPGNKGGQEKREGGVPVLRSAEVFTPLFREFDLDEGEDD